MAFDINEMRSQLVGGGARPSLFQVTINNPVGGAAANFKTPFMVRAASLPETQQGEVRVPYMGRDIHVQGNKTYNPWSITVINDEDFLVRDAFEKWLNAMNAPRRNINTFGSSNPNLYKTTADVTQFGKEGSILRTYTLIGCFPVVNNPIALDWEAKDILENFEVTLVYDYHIVSGGNTGKGGTDGE